jgi:hypothetical protein
MAKSTRGVRPGRRHPWLNPVPKPFLQLGHVLRVCEALGLWLDMSPEAEHQPAPAAGGAFTLDAVLDDYRRG